MDALHALASEVLAALRARGATLGTAESLTGGQLAAAVTAVPGASSVYRGGVVSYATEVKIAVLGVPAEVVERHGVISAPCARAMAEGAARVVGATYALSTTGVAGPDRQEDQPAGTVHVGVLTPDGVESLALHLEGDRAAIQAATCRAALSALRDMLGREDGALR